MSKLDLRFKLLYDAKVIDEDTYNKILNLIFYLKEKWKYNLENDIGEMFTTHVAMALKRIKDKVEIISIDRSIYEEAKNNENIDYIFNIYEDLEEKIFKIKLPEIEKEYIILNLMLLNENKNLCPIINYFFYLSILMYFISVFFYLSMNVSKLIDYQKTAKLILKEVSLNKISQKTKFLGTLTWIFFILETTFAFLGFLFSIIVFKIIIF